MSDLEKLIRYKRNIKLYLNELRELSLEVPLESDLLSLEATEQIRSGSKEALKGQHTRKIRLDFNEKNTERFKNYVANLHRLNPEPVFIWIARTNTCGLYSVSSLLKFNFDFSFDVNKEGLIVLLANDMNDTIILDFSCDESKSRNELEIDVCGDRWASIEY
jgi:hypothetical protein